MPRARQELEFSDADPYSGRMDYEAPSVVDYGGLADITAGMSDGEFLDRDFPTNTPKKDLTFS